MDLVLPGLIVVLLCFAATLWAILDIPRRVFETPRRQIFWLFAVATVPLFGALAYITCARPRTRPARTT